MPDLSGDLDIVNFEVRWNALSEKQLVLFIESSLQFGLDKAIAPVLKGLDSHHFTVRTQARKTLGVIQSKLQNLMDNAKESADYLKGMKASAQVCACIFARFISGIPLEEQRSLFKMLLMLDGTGPHFAVKTLYMGLVKISVVEKIISGMPDIHRLRFIGEHLKAPPALRLEYHQSIRRIIESISDEKAVVKFYAGLFDGGQDVDPVLYNLSPALRAPERLRSRYIQSDSPLMRDRGLKALAMIQPRLDSDLMLEILNNETDPGVRQTFYTIIENSAYGRYGDLFHPILERIESNEGSEDDQEAFLAFKALIVCGKIPLVDVLDMIKKNHPSLMGLIYKEIATLSKISFFFIQDIALHPDVYLNRHIEANLAAAYGMIKKRPERVVKIFKHHIKQINGNQKDETRRFIKKISQLLEKEKQSIVTPFKLRAKKIETPPQKKSDGLFDALFSTSLKKKLLLLKESPKNPLLDFDSEFIQNADLGKITISAAPVYFNRATLSGCNFSNATLFNTYFKNSILYNTDLRNATFDSVNFNNAVLMNVNATGAVFKNCSFLNISLFNCKFDQAQLDGAAFIGSTITHCTFSGTDLSGASFAYSNIAVVSFEDAVLNQADFSGIRTRFCRFPTHARSAIAYDDINLNARQHQLDMEDMPMLNEGLLANINMLIFAEFIHYGEMKFVKQNRLSQLTALDIFNSHQVDLFLMIPYLIHTNQTLKGMNPSIHPETPCGIYDYHPESETLKTVSKYSMGKKPEERLANPAIEGVFTIGSIGSVAQTDDSDIDYWICINEAQLTSSQMKLLEKKLAGLERYAQNEFRIQVTFFLVDINRARANDFGSSSTESSGSAQSILLKEEFYRTMIHLAGKIPLWAVLPTSISKKYYTRLYKVISNFPNMTRYIDLGDIHTIPPGEFFGATIWQLFKSLKSPFKSIIKMALLEKSIHEQGKKALLCNRVKDEWMNSGLNLRLAQNDAYYILINDLLDHYQKTGDLDSRDLLLTCFHLKLGLTQESDIRNSAFGLRHVLIEKCIKDWGFSKEKMLQGGQLESWSHRKRLSFSAVIESHMIRKYKAVNQTFDVLTKKAALISPEDRTVLGRKVYSEISKRNGKVSKILLISTGHAQYHGLQFGYVPSNTKGSWELLNRTGQGEPESLMTAKTIEELGAWLIRNHVYKPLSPIKLLPNETPVTANDLISLLDALYDFFTPLIKVPVKFEALLEKERITHLFISMNFYAPRLQKEITHCTAVYLNSWGEMFIRHFSLSQPFSNRIKLMRYIALQLTGKPFTEKSVCFINGHLKKD